MATKPNGKPVDSQKPANGGKPAQKPGQNPVKK